MWPMTPISGMSEACTQRSPTPSWVLSGSRIRPSRCRRRPLCEGPRSPAGPSTTMRSTSSSALHRRRSPHGGKRALSELPLPPDLRLPPPWVVGRHRPKQNRRRGTPGCTPGSALPLFMFLFSSAPVPPSARTGGCWTGWTGTAPRRGAEAADGGPVPPAWHDSAPTPR